MEKVKPRTLSGFMELLPAPQVQMERIMQVLRETYALYGFYPLDTPLIESSEVLLAKGGGETEKQIYRFTKGDSDLSLRFDLTVPLAKYVAQHYGELTFPFRRFQIGKVYRGERAQRGASASSIRPTSTSSATASSTSSTRPRFRASSTKRSPRSVSSASRSASTTARCSTASLPSSV